MTRIYSLLAILLFSLLRLAAEQKAPGYHLALTVQKLEKGFDPPRKMQVLVVGKSMVGDALRDGKSLRNLLLPDFPHCPEIELLIKTQDDATWANSLDWSLETLTGEGSDSTLINPDLIIVYATGKPGDLESLLTEIRQRSTADILVPSIHWRAVDSPNWGRSENAVDQDISILRETCKKHGVEMVENRKLWANYLEENNAKIGSLLRDDMHPNELGIELLRKHILSHLKRSEKKYGYLPRDRERKVKLFLSFEPDEDFQFPFTGNRIDIIYQKSPDGGTAQVFIGSKLVGQINFAGEDKKLLRKTAAQNLLNKNHVLRLKPTEGETLNLRGLEIYEPPLKSNPSPK